MEIETVTFFINGSVKLIFPFDLQKFIKVISRSVPFCRVFDLKFNGIHLSQIILKFWVVCRQNIIDVPVCEIEPKCQLFSSGWEQRLHKFCFILEEKYVDQKRGTMRSHWNIRIGCRSRYWVRKVCTNPEMRQIYGQSAQRLRFPNNKTYTYLGMLQ